MEFVTMERLWSQSSEEDSYHPYTCTVASMPFMECLDIGSARTLGGALDNATAYNMSGSSGDLKMNFYSILELEGLLNMTGVNASTINLFGADVSCNGKNVGDGAINTYDMAVLMWYQFRFEPYDQLPSNPMIVRTVEGRDDTRFRCEVDETRRMWQLAIGNDYCHSGQNALMLGYTSGRRMSQELVPESHTNPLSNMLSKYVHGYASSYRSTGNQQEHLTEELYGERETSSSEGRRLNVLEEDILRDVNAMWTLDINVAEWAKVEGYGRWIRMKSPGVHVALELYLTGIFVDHPVHLSLQAAPPMNCTECVPIDENPEEVVVAFARRHEYASEGPLAMHGSSTCANIVSAGLQTTVMLGSTISIRQQPPNKACAFDLFLWVPESPADGIHVSKSSLPYSHPARRLSQVGAESTVKTRNSGCSNDIGVLPGSSSMDAFRGKVQRKTSCTVYDITDPETINPPSPPAQCDPPQTPQYCNPHAPARTQLVAGSFASRTSNNFFENIFSVSLNIMRGIGMRARSRNMQFTDFKEFEMMLYLESQTNDCCSGYTCIPQNASNETLGICHTADSPFSPPSPPPSTPPSTPPLRTANGTVTGIVMMSIFSLAGICFCFGVRAIMPAKKCDVDDKNPLIDQNEKSMLFSMEELNTIPRDLRRLQKYK